MKRLLALWILVCAAFAVFLPGIAVRAAEATAAQEAAADVPSRPVLRRSVSVEGDVVRLSDLFESMGTMADRPIAYAPQPGRSATLDAERLRDIAVRHRLPWRPRPFERVVVTRASRQIGAEAIIAEVKAALREDGHEDQEIWVELEGRGMNVHLPSNVTPSLALDNFRYDKRTGRFSASLQVPADAPIKVIPLAGEIHRVAEVPVLARRVKRGEVIGEDDIEWVKMRADRLGRNVVTEADDLIGKAPRRMLRAGALVRMSDVREPVVIEKGAIVMMRYQTRFMTLTARGRALDDGNMGGTVRVMNIQSKRTVEAEVLGSDSVAVIGAGGLALNR